MSALRHRLDEVQTKPVNNVLKALKTEHRALLQMATGTGKTNTAIKVFQKLYSQNKNIRVLWLTHLAELAQQSYHRFVDVAGLTPGVDVGLYSGAIKDKEAKVVVATVQSISKKDNLESFDPSNFDYIFVDEAHHTPASTWKKVLEYFPKAKKFGFTATPNRPDGKRDIQDVFGEEPVFELSYKDAVKKKLVAKAEGWLVLTDSVIQPKFDTNGDFARSSLDRLWTTHGRQETILNAYKKYGRREMKKMGLPFKTICYCINTHHAKEMAKLFNANGIVASVLVGDGKVLTPAQRLLVFHEFTNIDKTEVICVVNIFNEGVDLPGVGCMLMARPTKSNIIYWQQLGRGVRRIDGKKEKVIVIDFVDNAEKEFLGYNSANIENKGMSHKRIVTEFLKEPDLVKVERRILDLTLSVEKFDNQFRLPWGSINKETCIQCAKKVKSRQEFRLKYPSHWRISISNNWYQECTAHLPNIISWNKNKVLKHAKKYRHVSDWKLNSSGASSHAFRNGYFKEATKHMSRKRSFERYVLNLETKLFYASMKEAELKTGIRASKIGIVCGGVGPNKTAGGYRWAYCDENGKVIKNKGKKK